MWLYEKAVSVVVVMTVYLIVSMAVVVLEKGCISSMAVVVAVGMV